MKKKDTTTGMVRTWNAVPSYDDSAFLGHEEEYDDRDQG
jgi:hypothetical protein